VFSTHDTIVAVATPAGRGAIGVVRLSGPDAARIACALTDRDKPFEPRHATFARVSGARRRSIQDQAIVTVFPAPASYTGEDVVEISAHGSPVVLAGIVEGAMAAGARLAEPGEFTLRAFLHGKLDLVQAEAVGDLVNARTPLQARAAFDQLEGTLTGEIERLEQAVFDVMARLEASLDFPEEGYHFTNPKDAAAAVTRVVDEIDRLLRHSTRGRLIREGAQVAIVGLPNVGKSSLFNALVNASRAIVTDVPGTTRDLVTEQTDLGGLLMTLVDTAGMRETTDVVEREGVARARQAREVADLVLVVLDRSRPLGEGDHALIEQTAARPHLIVANKSDLPPAWDEPRRVWSSAPGDENNRAGVVGPLLVSARTGQGLDWLVTCMASVLSRGEERRDPPIITNIRHVRLLEQARLALARAIDGLEGGAPEELPLVDLLEASQALQEVTGQRAPDDLLRHIFEHFCIGK
jgi:tRNA modification GTPase